MINFKAELTEREWEVLGWIATGHSFKEAADEMGIKYRTADNHVQNIKQKIHCQKSTELTMFWFCHQFNIPISLCEMKRKVVATFLALLFIHSISVADWYTCRSIRLETGRITTMRSGRTRRIEM